MRLIRPIPNRADEKTDVSGRIEVLGVFGAQVEEQAVPVPEPLPAGILEVGVGDIACDIERLSVLRSVIGVIDSRTISKACDC